MFALLLGAVLNVLLPLAFVTPALAAVEAGKAETALLSDSQVICTAQGIGSLNTPTPPAAPSPNGHCTFCFTGVTPALLANVDVDTFRYSALRITTFSTSIDQTILNSTTRSSNPRAPPLFL